VRRHQYAALLEAVQAGEVDRIVVYMTSRLWRNRAERAQAFEILRTHHVSVSAVKGPELDMSSAMGRGIAGMLGEFDTMESEVKSERVKRAAQQRRAEGRPNGPALYGWRRRAITDEAGRVVQRVDEVDPEQAAIVQEIVRRLLEGDSLNAIARDLEDR
jgi:DNA invertase Pin-like site-specific DNA recombinase